MRQISVETFHRRREEKRKAGARQQFDKRIHIYYVKEMDVSRKTFQEDKDLSSIYAEGKLRGNTSILRMAVGGRSSLGRKQGFLKHR